MGLKQPLEIAIIGAGDRSTNIYLPLFESLTPWVRLVAVCDPVKENADFYADQMDVEAFYTVPELVRSASFEAAIVVSPIDVHHATSCYLSQHGLHNLVETGMSSLLGQAQQMVQTAQDNQVIFRVAENFFRFPFDRLAKKLDDTGFLGPIKRITCLHGSAGYHNSSRWLHFYGAHPEAVQAISHTMPTEPHYEVPHRFHTSENFRSRFFFFPDNRLVNDVSGNSKGMLGRYVRPGYTELNGARGTIARFATRAWHGEAEVRYCSDDSLQDGARADQIYPIEHISENGCWTVEGVDLPIGRVEYVNPYRPTNTPSSFAPRDYYAAAVMDHVVDFAYAVRGKAESEYMPEDALMVMMMEVGARESALQNGQRLALPLTGDLESESQRRKALKERYGVDPMDIEGMLATAVPRI